MKIRIIITLIVVIGVMGFIIKSNLPIIEAQTDNREIPNVVVLAEKSALGKVTFNHGNHTTQNYSVDGTTTLKCVECHHVEQPAGEVVKDPLHKTAFPADRTAILTAESYKDPKTPAVTKCQSCHAPKDTKPTALAEIPQITKGDKTTSLTNQNAFHMKCASCHDEVMKARPTAKAPKTTQCVVCHKKSA